MSTKNWTFEFGGVTKDWPQVVCGDGPADLIARTYGAGATEHAHLIAAAPDLYAALREAVEWFELMGTDERNSRLLAARAAIAKARGEG